jgi:cyclophilin family peptidyl-prolyl cis-trans isomerase
MRWTDTPRKTPWVMLLTALLALGLRSALVAAQPAGAQSLTPPSSGSPRQAPAPSAATGPQVLMRTSMGDITIRLFPDKAPISVANFLSYVDEGFYNGTIFHRVSEGYVVQGGGFTSNMTKKDTRPPIKNEAGNGLSNRRGTVAMARINLVDSATSQFFINVADNTFIDHKNDTPRDFGYAVFGEVVSGMEVVDRISAVKTGSKGPFPGECPLESVTILSITRAGS